jgi:hypothetical protein
MKTTFLFRVFAVGLLLFSGCAEAREVSRVTNPTCSDLSLVLAIDSSGSIDDGEYALQIAGYAAAFSDRSVQKAIAAAGVVDLAVVFWADSDFPFQIVPWHRIGAPVDAMRFAADILATRRLAIGDTDIGAGLGAALDLLDLPRRCTTRAVINVSGDGKASISPKRKAGSISLSRARAKAADLGVVINGLAILNQEPDLESYYREQLIVGEGAFVMHAVGFDDFARAIKKKILREVEATLTASLLP